MPKERSFPVSLEFIDVVSHFGSSHTGSSHFGSRCWLKLFAKAAELAVSVRVFLCCHTDNDVAPGTEACLQHDGCFHTAVLERRAGGCLFWHDTCNDRQQILAVYWSAAPARDSGAPAKEYVAPASQRDLMTRYAQWDKFTADLAFGHRQCRGRRQWHV